MRARIVTASTIITGALCYGLVGLLGYWTYGSNVHANILEGNYPSDNASVAVARIAETIVVAVCIPLQFNPARRCWVSLVQRLARLLHEKYPSCVSAPPDWIDSVGDVRSTPYAVATACLVAVVYAFGMRVTNLGIVFGVFGATGAVATSYWLPGLIYYKICDDIKGLWFAMFGGALSIVCVVALFL
jgi:amino acid permease